MAFSLWTLVCDQLKPTTGQRITLKKGHLSELYTLKARDTVRRHWSGDTLFDSSQLTIIWMSIRMSTINISLN